MQPRILIIGNANIDLQMNMRRLPEEGQTVYSGNSYVFSPGGKSSNTAIACSRLGADVMYCARVGNDNNGERLKQVYLNENISPRFITTDRTLPTGLTAIIREGTSKERKIVYSGANSNLSNDDLEEAFMSYPDFILTQLEAKNEIVLEAINEANLEGIPVVLDPSPAKHDFPFYSLGKIEILTPNEKDIFTYTGIRMLSAEDMLRASIILSTKIDAKYIVTRLGTRGAFIYDGKYSHFVPAYRVDGESTEGSEDAFVSAMTIEYIKTRDIKKAVHYGVIASCLTISKGGNIKSFPYEDEVNRFIETNSIIL